VSRAGRVGRARSSHHVQRVRSPRNFSEFGASLPVEAHLLLQPVADVGSALDQTSEITSDIGDRIDFTKQVLAVWDSAPVDDRRVVIDWWVDSVIVKPGPKKGSGGRGRRRS
jgi:hypothetical protein